MKSLLAAALAAVVVAPLAQSLSGQAVASTASAARAAAAPTDRGVVLVIVDDMRADEMRVMPKTRAWLQDSGARFTNAYAPTPLCCPARATILTGQYAHNHGVMDNNSTPPHPGSVTAFDDSRTLATVLDDSVYTGYVGKYLNRYGEPNGIGSSYVPPGWDHWWPGTKGEYNYMPDTTYTPNGTHNVTIDGYQTNVETELGQRFLRRKGSDPFFLVLNYLAPHSDVDLRSPGRDRPLPARRYRGDFRGTGARRTPAFNEKDVSDKPPAYQRPLMSAALVKRVDRLADARYETLQSVDQGMGRLRRTLRQEGLIGTTDVIFVSDNGYMLGEHRFPAGKGLQYEPSVRVPLLMAGPDVPRVGLRRQLVGLHDLASTITTWLGVGPMPGSDGVDLGPVLAGEKPDRDLLLEGWYDSDPGRDFASLRTPEGFKYTEFVNGQRELYDLRVDPHETANLAEQPAYAETVAELSAQLHVLQTCAEDSCR